MLNKSKIILHCLSLVTLICLLNIQCTTKSQAKSKLLNFDSIQLQNELYLIQTDDKFGEWGGDTYLVRIYRGIQSGNLIIDYIEYKGKVGPQIPPDSNSKLIIDWFTGQPILFEKKGTIANDEFLNLISNAINELIITKVNNGEFVAMAGVVNQVMFSDSSLIIRDYPSTNWDKFHILKNKLKMK